VTITLSVDAMGGDNAPEIVIQGLAIAAGRYPSVHFLLYGDPKEVEPLLAKKKELAEKVTFIPCKEIITPDTKPSVAIRGLPNSSMRQAIKAVADGRALGVISAGNTGAYMVLAKMLLKTMPGIDRPALASLAPTLRGESVLLDLGANVECSSQNLQQFAIMGEIFARLVLHLTTPKVGLINVGSEDIKGSSIVKEAAELIRTSSIKENFYGFIEGDDIMRGTVDVVVMDGFTGNVVLKAGEGVMHLALQYFKEAFKSSWMARLGYLLANSMLKKLTVRLDYRRYNGGIWLGLNGIAIKSHGGADALGFAHAIDLAVDMVTSNITDHFLKEFGSKPCLQEVVNK
jgi:glycerol-3-phosphate acyltransferase PlsX